IIGPQAEPVRQGNGEHACHSLLLVSVDITPGNIGAGGMVIDKRRDGCLPGFGAAGVHYRYQGQNNPDFILHYSSPALMSAMATPALVPILSAPALRKAITWLRSRMPPE